MLRAAAKLIASSAFLFVLTWTVATSSMAAQQQLQTRLHKSESVVRFFRNPDHKWLLASRQENCKAVPWTRSCKVARGLMQKHVPRIKTLRWQIQRTLPSTDNWVAAMRTAQKPFPGTYGWLEFISNRECRACYTAGFTMNYRGSGAGGWMQFMSGTFYGYSDEAAAWLGRRGYLFDPAVFDWHNPLGQALTAAYMRYTDQDGCHWCP